MHPKFQNGEMTEEQIFHKFLNTFEVGSAEMDGKVRIHLMPNDVTHRERQLMGVVITLKSKISRAI